MTTFNQKHSNIVLVDNLIVSLMDMKRRHKKQMNFGTVFRPLYYLSRMWGLASFSIGTNSNGELQPPKIRLHDGLWLSATIMIYSLFVYNTLSSYRPSKINLSQKTWVMMVSSHLLELFGSIYGIFGIIMSVSNRFKLISMVKLLTRFDREVFIEVKLTSPFTNLHNHNSYLSFSQKMTKLKVYFDYEHSYRRIKMYCIASLLLIVVFPSVSLFVRMKYSGKSYTTDQTLLMFCLISFQLSGRIIPCLLYTVFLHTAYKRYLALNIFLRYGA